MWIVVSIVLFGAVFYLLRVSLLGTKLRWVTQRTDLTDRQKRQSAVGVGVAIGSGVGVALGVALDNIAVGVAVGVGVGAALAAALK